MSESENILSGVLRKKPTLSIASSNMTAKDEEIEID